MQEAIDFEFKKNLIKKQRVFAQLNEAEIDELTNLFIEKTFRVNETIVTEGDYVESVYLIVSGTADVRHISVENGQLKTESLAKLGPEQAIGLNETGFYSLSGRRTATVVAITDMVLLRMSVAAFNGFCLSHTRVNEIMHRTAKTATDAQS
jgi:CRP-like cAMP-binding protein